MILEALEVPEEFKRNAPKGTGGIRKNGKVERGQRWIAARLLRNTMMFGVVFGLAVALPARWKRGSVAGLVLIACLMLVNTQAHAGEKSVDSWIQKLGDDDASETVGKLVAFAAADGEGRNNAIQRLIVLAKNEKAKVTARGWAIVALGEIGGLEVDEALLSIHKNSSNRPAPPNAFGGRRIMPGGIYAPQSQPATEEELVQTWAAAARIAMCRSADSIIEKASLINQFPSLARPISQRLVAEMSDVDTPVEKMLEVSMNVHQVAGPLAPAILARGAEELIATMSTHSDQNIRRQAAAYLANLGAEDLEGVAKDVIGKYQFVSNADTVPWAGGPLFVPSISWSKQHATDLMRELVAWDIHSAQVDDMNLQRQLHNNLRNLANRLGIRRGSEGFNWQFNSPREWFEMWGKIAGKAEASELLDQVGVPKDSPYWRALKRL